MPVDPKFIVNLKGKDFVMLGGLLDLAHNSGLIGIETVLVENLSDPKEHSYVFQAIGRFRCSEGEAVWSAYGDASPSNSQMRGATLRHAETRAIARMLRMATNVATTAFEELGPDGDTQSAGNGQGAGGRGHSVQRSAPPRTNTARSNVDVAPLPLRETPGAVVGEPAEDPYFCSFCGVEVPDKVAQISLQRFSAVLCVPCGKERMVLERANLPAPAVAA